MRKHIIYLAILLLALPLVLSDDCGILGGVVSGGECQIKSVVFRNGTYSINQTLHVLGNASINSQTGLALLITDDLIVDTPTVANGGQINCNDILATHACLLTISANNIDLKAGAEVNSENRGGAGSGSNITMFASGNMILRESGSTRALISSTREVTTGTGNAGFILLTITGHFESFGNVFATTTNGNGGNIGITANNITLYDGDISSSKSASGTGVAGNISLIAADHFEQEDDSEIHADAGTGSAGYIKILAKTIEIDGDISSESGETGTGAFQKPGGGPIDIISSCDLTIEDDGDVESLGLDPGADRVHLESGCDMIIDGEVRSSGHGHAVPNRPPNHCDNTYRPDKLADSTSCVELWSGKNLIINGFNENGEIDTDHFGPDGGRSWIDIFARNNVTILGGVEDFAIHADNSVTNHEGGIVTVKSLEGNIFGFRNIIRATSTGAGGEGGNITIQSTLQINLSRAQLWATGDFVATGGFGNGGKINVTANAVSWRNGTGDVRPTGTTITPAAKRGNVSITSCLAADLFGTQFPFIGNQTTPGVFSQCGTHITLPSYVLLPTCACGGEEPFCGDQVIDPGEQCEPPNTDNSQFCGQTTTQCSGNLTGSRDAFGSCTDVCGCVEDQFSYQCVKDSCGAECAVDADCPLNDCDYLDGCYNNQLFDCQDIQNTCSQSCGCSNEQCSLEACVLAGNDQDQDGYDAQCGDCDDTDPDVNPGMNETCNGKDDDCDGQIDEGFDMDQDGVANCFDNCPAEPNPNQADEDGDGVGDVCDECPDSKPGEPVDAYGCDPFQFCEQFNCGRACDLADFNYDEPRQRPFDCITSVIHKEGTLQPACLPIACEIEDPE
ncbi:hypothetical protein J4464_07310 [Candidatus Woesearchaeota archaeon]|nr:hypothetical protein [Candidatus Woesearchaeota archaeon]